MTSITAGGTLVALSTSAPATFDSSGYGAVSGFTTVGEVDDVQGEIGRLYELATRYALARDGAPTHAVTNFDDGSITLPIALDFADAGQDLIRANAGNTLTVKITLPSGVIIYCQAILLGAPINIGNTTSFIMHNAQLKIITSSTGVGIVIVES